jgi:gas vesicle protein
MKSFLVGLGIGLGLGVLFAPMSGEETRNNIAQRASDLADSARETYEHGKDRVRAGITAIRDAAQGTGQQATRPTGTEPSV